MWGFFSFSFFLPYLSYLAPFSTVVGLDIQDEMGRHEVGHIDNSMKIPLNQGDGCRFEGEFSINKVSLECLFVDPRWSSSCPPDASCVTLSSAFISINPAVAEIFGIRGAFRSYAPFSFQLNACVCMRAHTWRWLITELNALQVPPMCFLATTLKLYLSSR